MEQTVPQPTLVGEAAPFQLAVALNAGAIVLREEQVPKAEQAFASLDFVTMSPADVLKIGFEAEQSLQRTLDGFLAKIDRKNGAKIFDLFNRLQKGVDDAELADVLAQVQKGSNPGIIKRLIAMIFGKDLDELIRELMESVGETITGKTKTLKDLMQGLEGELTTETQRLVGEIRVLEQLKRAYGDHFSDFTVQAAVANALLVKARVIVSEKELALDPDDVVARTELQGLKSKLTLLESRSLALEGVYTRLPADAAVIDQIEGAGVSTLQETATTMGSRFASIKMTLIAIHGAFAVKSVQQLGAKSAKMDEQLTALRGQAVKDIAVTAATAPGDNRLAQAQQIKGIIDTVRETRDLVRAAEQETAQKFETARAMLEESRNDLAALATS